MTSNLHITMMSQHWRDSDYMKMRLITHSVEISWYMYCKANDLKFAKSFFQK